MQLAKFLFVSALPISTLSFSLACKPSTGATTETPETTTRVPHVDPLAAWFTEHMGPRFFVSHVPTDPQRGAQDKPLVTIVMFTEYGPIPHPALTKHIDQLLAAHGDELLVVIKPIANDDNPASRIAALAVLAAEEQKLGWEMHELLIESRGVKSEEEALRYAEQIGVPDLVRFNVAIGPVANDELEANNTDAGRLGVNTGLFLFVNGAPYTDIVSFDDLSGIHAAERQLAVDLLEAGAEAAGLQATILHHALFERDPAIAYRHPFDGTPSSSKTLASDILIEDFVIGEGEPVVENTLITYTFRTYSTVDPKQIMGSSAKGSKLLISELGRKQDPIARATIDALLGMQPGGKRRVRIPAAIAESGAAPGTAPTGDLIVTVELVSVGPAPVLAGLDAFSGKPLQSKKSRNGLLVQDYAAGEGEAAKPGDVVALHYIGHLADGTEFDNSHGRGDELEVTLGGKQVIPGFDLGLEGAKAGMLRKIVIPPKLGYGDEPRGPIPAGSKLTFYVQIMSVSPPAQPTVEPPAK